MQNWIFTLVINSLVTTLLIMILSGLTLILNRNWLQGFDTFYGWPSCSASWFLFVPFLGRESWKYHLLPLREVVGQAVPVQFLNRHRPMVFGPALTTSHGLSWYWPSGWWLPSYSLSDSSMPIGIWSRWSNDGGGRLPIPPISGLWRRPGSYWLARKRSSSSIIPW